MEGHHDFGRMHWMRIDKSDKKCKMIIEFKMIKFEFKTMERRERICSLKTAEITQRSVFQYPFSSIDLRHVAEKTVRLPDKMER